MESRDSSKESTLENRENIRENKENRENKASPPTSILNTVHNTIPNTTTTGNAFFDEFLCGGYETDVITTIYGPSGSGKTNLCLLTMLESIKKNKKVIFIDTEGGFSLNRIEQLMPEFKKILDKILIIRPMNFEEQKKAFEKLKILVNRESGKDSVRDSSREGNKESSIGLIIVDSISMLYRLEMGKNEDKTNTNRELSYQISILTEIARKNKIPVIVTNQVYSSFEERDKINMVGGDLLKYSSKCLIELEKYASGIRAAVIKKHRSLPEGRCVKFRIINEGIENVEEKIKE